MAAEDITKATISAAMQKLYELSVLGQIFMFVNPGNVDEITGLYVNAANSTINLTAGDSTVGIAVTEIKTNFGVAKLVLSNFVPVKSVLFASLETIEMPTLRDAQYSPLAKIGDAETGQVVMETSVIAAPKSLVKIINIK